MEAPASAAAPRGRAALVALYQVTDGSNWKDNASGLSDAPLDDWYGVTTDTDNRVSILYLADNNLAGPLPAEWDNLTNLTSLDLAGNNLQGPLPVEWGQLVQLTVLFLANNCLAGLLPAELGYLSKLEWLDLSENCLTGLVALEGLYFDDTELCASQDRASQTWLRGIRDVCGANCYNC